MRGWIFDISSPKELIIALEEELSELRISEDDESEEEEAEVDEDEAEESFRRDAKLDAALEALHMYVKNYRQCAYCSLDFGRFPKLSRLCNRSMAYWKRQQEVFHYSLSVAF